MQTVHILSSQKVFRVGKIVCLARNYADHIKELGNEVPDKPVLFIKPATSIIRDGENVVIPAYSNDCHYEVELAVLIGKYAKNVPEREAMSHVAGYGVAIDMTLRDVQSELKAKGLPWEIAKGFDTACPLSDFVAASEVEDPHDLGIRLSVDGQVRQDASTALMMRRLPAIIQAISAIFTLEEGDIILTGTPAGVGPVGRGSRLRAEIDRVGCLEVGVK
ncbi:MAG: fumarylacetoacetate hydrolase family protein [Desulfuromonadales bacterium]|uniref:fumarylacetoacetate hydrolase family protein n=1 Tax=Desulfuromonas sp. KJ2020 TaxID=2919173 RepID=UPI0020A7B170|nr:fumarylacetoacetate hydrolase family protein [Desulfuromonas sp. KJ2020]MCP3176869.1 fumarylacetoacetate hydrolase family protein [Desulfuromonas sp. KJ2020]